MSATANPAMPVRHRSVTKPWRRMALFACIVVVLVSALAGDMTDGVTRGLYAVGLSLSAVLVLSTIREWSLDRRAKLVDELVSSYLRSDTSPGIITDSRGCVRFANAAAKASFNVDDHGSLDVLLRSFFPSPAAVLLRLQSVAQRKGVAQDELVTGRGIIKISAQLLGKDTYLWRLTSVPGGDSYNGDDVEGLPMVTVGRSNRIQFANEPAHNLFGFAPGNLKQVIAEQDIRPGSIVKVQSKTGMVPVAIAEIRKTVGSRKIALCPLGPEVFMAPAPSFNDLPVPLMRLSAQGEVLETNPLADELLGCTPQDGTTVEQIMHGLGRPIRDWLRETIEGSVKPRSEFLRLSRPDRETFVQVTLSKVVRFGETSLIAVLNDATELKTLEAQFVQSQKMQAVGQLAGGVAHDFNNLLTAISGHCDLLLLRHDQGDPDYGDLIQINQNANRAAALIGQLLAFSRKQTLRPETLDMRDTLSDLIHLLNRLVGEKITLTLSHDPVLKPVRADKRQLEQVLMNLVVNARDAMPKGGEIRIETEVVAFDQPLKRDRAEMPIGEYVSVKVIDEGVGITADKLPKVFEPFYTTKRTGEGTGLGLSTVYGIVKQTGGFIFVDSVEGRGSEFTLYLPVWHEVEVIEPRVSDSNTVPIPKHGEGVVLLVEDEASVRAFASRALRMRGYTVLEAETGEEALAVLAEGEVLVDIIVTDVVMPGMDGPTWVKKALKNRPDVRVIFVSGYAEGAFGETEPEFAHSVFLPKPFSLNQLTETVFQQLN